MLKTFRNVRDEKCRRVVWWHSLSWCGATEENHQLKVFFIPRNRLISDGFIFKLSSFSFLESNKNVNIKPFVIKWETFFFLEIYIISPIGWIKAKICSLKNNTLISSLRLFLYFLLIKSVWVWMRLCMSSSACMCVEYENDSDKSQNINLCTCLYLG